MLYLFLQLVGGIGSAHVFRGADIWRYQAARVGKSLNVPKCLRGGPVKRT